MIAHAGARIECRGSNAATERGDTTQRICGCDGPFVPVLAAVDTRRSTDPRNRWHMEACGHMRRWILRLVALVIVGFVAIQLVPYGRAHTNPPMTGEPTWDSATTRALAVRACFDCHSNESVWPWYSNIAPASWLLQRHVDEGREKLNFSTWGTGEQEAEHAADLVVRGEMPPGDYLLLHPEARLADAEKQQLVNGLAKTFGREGGGDGEGGDGEADDD
jgi:hypothetical protein